MGGGSSRQYIVDEQLKPANASDIPDGDFEAAKREVERLRLLIARVDCDMLESYEEKHNKVKVAPSPDEISSPVKSPVGNDKTSLLESAEGQEYWNTLGKPLPVQKPKQGAPEHGVDKGSSLESAEGAAYWKGDEIVKDSSKSKVIDDDGYVIVPKLSSQESKEVMQMNTLLDDIKRRIFAKTRTLEEAFLEMDTDKSGFISRTEFRSCLSMMGYFITEEDFDLINKTYPHHEKNADDDKGISYLEFITMLTGKLTYVPGFGEDFDISEVDQARAKLCHDASFEVLEERNEMWHTYLTEKREREHKIQQMFSKKVFEEFYSMKEAFNNMDQDHSGYIDPIEMKGVLLTAFNIEATEEDILDLMDKFDTNHDGKLAYHEFVKLLQVDDVIADI